jgi:hypothetical protein
MVPVFGCPDFGSPLVFHKTKKYPPNFSKAPLSDDIQERDLTGDAPLSEEREP